MPAIKIRSYTVTKKGVRGMSVSLPASWVDDVGVKPGDRLDIFRDEHDRLIIEKAKPTGGTQ